MNSQDLQQVLDELMLSITQPADGSRPSPLILEAVPGIRDALLRCDGKAVALAQVRGSARHQEQ